MALRIEIVTALARFAELERPWQDLWARAEADVFQSHGWIATWWRGVSGRSGSSLLIALAWRDEELVAVAPFAVHNLGVVRTLRWAAELFSDYCDALVDPGLEVLPILTAVWDKVIQAGGFDTVSLKQVRPDARARPLLDRIARRSGHSAFDPTNRCLGIRREWPDGEAFFRSLGKKGRNNHTRGKRILAELGGEVAFRCYGTDQPVGTVLDRVIALKRDWLQANDPGSALLGGDGVILRALLDTVAATGELRVFAIECGQTLVAGSVNFLRGNTMQAYLTSYDPAYGRASPGTMLMVEYAIWAFDRSMGYVDFLRGDEAFKLGMANSAVELSSLVTPRTLLGRAALAARDLRSRARDRVPAVMARLGSSRGGSIGDKSQELVPSETEGL
ncbi:MAG: GNAT family N-acetyltransferase [Pseudomonadota bacterium]|nr:GNAT family N-acetyltransferase [Pseudomonadota bacterium]